MIPFIASGCKSFVIRTLRYYEQVGLLQSVRPPLVKYRFYDAAKVLTI